MDAFLSDFQRGSTPTSVQAEFWAFRSTENQVNIVKKITKESKGLLESVPLSKLLSLFVLQYCIGASIMDEGLIVPGTVQTI